MSESVVLLQENACPHTATHTVETLKKLNFEVVEHPLYSLELSPSDSPVWSTNQALRGHQFTTDQQLDVTVHAWIVSEPKTFYSEGIKQIVW